MEANAGFDVKQQLQDVEHKIALELFNISRVVDDGNFHIVLDNNTATTLKLIHEIPVCCKVSLEGQQPPLHIKVTGMNKKDNL